MAKYEAYQFVFREAGRDYQLLMRVPSGAEIKVMETKRLSPWIGSGPVENPTLKKINKATPLSDIESKLLEENECII